MPQIFESATAEVLGVMDENDTQPRPYDVPRLSESERDRFVGGDG